MIIAFVPVGYDADAMEYIPRSRIIGVEVYKTPHKSDHLIQVGLRKIYIKDKQCPLFAILLRNNAMIIENSLGMFKDYLKYGS